MVMFQLIVIVQVNAGILERPEMSQLMSEYRLLPAKGDDLGQALLPHQLR
jgi:hypothetical protein